MTQMALPERIDGEQHLERMLSEPTGAAIEALGRIDGDLIVLGAGGKMGPSLAMSHVNVIWQGDANAMALASLAGAANPPLTLNIAGCERLRVRDVAERFGQLLAKPVKLTGSESPTALLSDGSRGHDLYGPPRVSAELLMRWVADWIERGGVTWNRPTHFEVRDGKF